MPTFNDFAIFKETDDKYYTLGALMRMVQKGPTFYFSNRDNNLVQRVAGFFDSTYAITPVDCGGYKSQICEAPNTKNYLESLGFFEPYTKREFPEIPQEFEPAFIIGLLDASTVPWYLNDELLLMSVALSKSAIKTLYAKLVHYARITKKPTTTRRLNFGEKDAARIAVFINNSEVESSETQKIRWNLFRLKELNERYNINFDLSASRELLASGINSGDAASAIGYRPDSFSKAFKTAFGISPRYYQSIMSQLVVP